MRFISPAIRYGLYAAAGMSAWLALAYASGLHSRLVHWSRWTDWGTEIALALALWWLLRHHLYASNRYWLPVWQGVLHGLLCSLVATAAYYVVYNFYLHFINPAYPDLYLEWRVGALRDAGVAETTVRDIARAYRWSTSPLGLPLSLASYYLLVGFVLSPILTLWLNMRRKEVARAD